MTEVTISFPGIGIDPFTVDKVAFSIGNISVRWYGIILTLGIVAGVLYALYRSREEGVSTDDVLDFTIWTVLLAVIGARAYFVLTTLKDASGNWNYHSFLDVIAIWEGGIAIYGAIIGGAISVVLISYFKKYSKQKLLKVCDMVAPGVMLGQIIGRWGNFMNGEAHGYETAEDFFLRMGLWERNRMVYYHPTFLYESLWNLLGFVLINLLYRKKKFDGQVLLMYLAWYGFGRMFIEGMRTDSLYIGVFRISQVVGFLCFVICTALLVVFLVRAKRLSLDTEGYAPVYEKTRGLGLRLFARSDKAESDTVAQGDTVNEQDTADGQEKE